uniref:CUB domain-containing protein n=1 Tax=Panagrellus redivivus TaxID=6233 RepID=A0A7E4ZR26_PANRE
MKFTLSSDKHIYEFHVHAETMASANVVFKCPEKPDGETQQIVFQDLRNPIASFFCRPYVDQAVKQQSLQFHSRSEDFDCPVLLYLGPTMSITRATKKYPPYSLPSDMSPYIRPGDPLPENYFTINSNKLTIDIFNADGKEYTYYKGKGRPIPTMHLQSADICHGITVFMKLDSCSIRMKYTTSNIKVTINGKSKEVDSSPQSSLLVFTLSDVYFQTVGPLGMRHLGKCNFGNAFVDNEDFVMKTWYKTIKYGFSCELKLKFADPILIRRKPPTTLSTTTAKTTTKLMEVEVTEKLEEPKSASFSKWYIVIIACVVILVIIIAIIVAIAIICLRKKKKAQQVREIEQPQKSPAKTITEVELPLDATQEEDEPPTPIKIPEKQTPKKDETTNKAIKSVSAQAIRLREPRIYRTGKKEMLPVQPDTEKTVKTTNRTTVGSMTQQQTENESTRIQKLDYHDKEPAELIPMDIDYNAADNKVKPITMDNFWQVVESVGEVARFSPVFISDANDNFENVLFYVRNLKMLPGTPFKRLANRILEPMPKVDPGPKGEERIAVRVFITSHVPLTIEVHMIGKPPEMIFNVCECKQCQQLGHEMSKGRLFKALCIDPWPLLLCRLKRVPINHHCFVSVTNPTDKTKLHHIFIIRGTKDPPSLLPCERGCNIGSAFSHPNDFVLKSNDQRTLTVRTEATQED